MMIYTIVKVSKDGEVTKELVSVTADLDIHNERVDELFEMFSKTHSLKAMTKSLLVSAPIVMSLTVRTMPLG